MADGTCSADGCARPVRSSGGLCGACYQRSQRLLMPPCSLDGCERRAHGAGLCSMHLARLKAHGDVGPIDPLYNRGTARNEQKSGYVRVYRPGHPMVDAQGWVLEHRLVAYEAGLLTGREDKRHVHHKNHKRNDNRIENLEVLTAHDHASEHGREWRILDYDDLIARYRAGENCSELARSEGVNSATVYRLLVRNGVQVRKASANRVDVDDGELRRLHAQPRANVLRIAAEMGVSRAVIARRMKELGLPAFSPGRPRGA